MKALSIIITASMLFFSCKPVHDRPDTVYIPGKKEIESFEHSMDNIMKTLDITELSYAVVNDKQIIHTKGFGYSDSGEGLAVDEKTVYPVGALKDIFISAIVLKLYEKGSLDMKDYASDYNMQNAGIKSARLKNLLSHTAEGKPGTNFDYNQSVFNVLESVIETVTGKELATVLKKYITRKSRMKQTGIMNNSHSNKEWVSSVSDLAMFSVSLDNNTLFKDEETRELLYRPVYLENGERTPSALGWFIQYCNEKTLAWSFGQGDGYSSLIIKSLSDSLNLIVLCNSENLNSPFQLSKGNLLASPVASAFMKAFIFRNDTIINFSINGNKENLVQEIQQIIKSPYRNLLFNEYIAYVKMYDYMNNKDMLDKFTGCYEEALPLRVPLDLILSKQPYAVINNVGDYLNIKRGFSMDKDTQVNIFAVGEYRKVLEMNPWEYDNTELYFDMKNEKGRGFDWEDDDRQYRFNYGYSEVTGSFSSSDNIDFIQADPSDNKYLFEIKLPWKTLGHVKPVPGTKIGFDITVADNDGTNRHGALVWNSKLDERPWANTSVYGTLILTDKQNVRESDSVCYSVKAKEMFIIDGKAMKKWSDALRYEIKNPHLGSISDNKDLSARFCTKWDSENLYFLVEVTDNYKNVIPYSSDYGWIENEEHDTVWIMKMSDTRYAGGAVSNRYTDPVIILKRGNYELHYNSNVDNSMYRWTLEAPEICFYGIAVY